MAFRDGEAEEEKQSKECKHGLGMDAIRSALSTNIDSNSNSSVIGSDCGSSSSSGKREDSTGQRSQVYLLKVSELTANTTLLVVKGNKEKEKEKDRVDSVKTNGTKKKPAPHSDSSPSASSLKSAREDAIEEWLKVGDIASHYRL